jgi:nucleoside-diphosphate-sugar epimerase
MRVVVTGSAGHPGEAPVRAPGDSRPEVVGLDALDAPFTTDVGSITDRRLVGRCMAGVRAVFHAAPVGPRPPRRWVRDPAVRPAQGRR